MSALTTEQIRAIEHASEISRLMPVAMIVVAIARGQNSLINGPDMPGAETLTCEAAELADWAARKCRDKKALIYKLAGLELRGGST